MKTKIYVPVIKNTEGKLYEVKVSANDYSDRQKIPFAIQCRNEVRYSKLIVSKIKDVLCNVDLECTDGESLLEDFSSSTFSITLGIFLATRIFTYKSHFKTEKIYDGIFVTGNLAEKNDYLLSVEEIDKKFEAVKKFVRENPGKYLFIFVSDGDSYKFDFENLEVKQFDSSNALNDLYNFLFNMEISIDYDPIQKTFEIENKNELKTFLLNKIENWRIPGGTDLISFSLKLDEEKWPKQSDSEEIRGVYNESHYKEELLSKCFAYLFSKEFKEMHSSLEFDFNLIADGIINIVLGKNLFSDEDVDFDIVQKTNEGTYFSVSLPMPREICSEVQKLWSRYSEPPLLWDITKSNSYKEWKSKTLLPEMTYKLVTTIEKQTEMKVDFASYFDFSKWKFADGKLPD